MKSLLLVSLLSLSMAAHAQQKIRLDGPRMAKAEPLVLVDDTETDIKYLIINPNNIEKIDILKDSSATKIYGERGRNGVILIGTKPNTLLNKLDAILDQFHIAAADRQLRVCIDKVLVKDNSKILAEPSEIVSVEITTERHLNIPLEEYTGERYINIITRKPNTANR